MARTVGNDEHAMNNVRYDNIARLLKNPLPFSDGLFLRFAQRAKSRKQGGRWLTLGWEGRAVCSTARPGWGILVLVFLYKSFARCDEVVFEHHNFVFRCFG